MARVVIEHVHDSAAGVYRLVVGTEVWNTQTVVESRVVTESVTYPVTDDDGLTIVGTREEELEREVQEPREEQILTGYVDVEDFVFVDQDERWEGLDPDQVVQAQRQLVTDALGARRNMRRHPKMPTPLPGAGEEL